MRLHHELCANVVVSYNGGELAVRGAHHHKDDAAVGVLKCYRVDVFGIFCGGNSHSTALNELGEVTDVVVNRSENKLLGFGIVKNGRVASCRLVLKHDACNSGGACGTVVERSAFFAQEQIPVAKTCGEVVKVSNKFFTVSFGKRDGVFIDGAAVFGAEQNLAEFLVHEAHAFKVVARIPVVTNCPNAVLYGF